MKIAHLAIWVKDIEAIKAFYTLFFSADSGNKYFNPKKCFTSYFLSFPGSDVKLEIMHHPTVPDNRHRELSISPEDQFSGLIHFALSVGSKAEVDALTEKIRNAGHRVVGEPRWTGDGYYESVVLDPEGNMIEITI